ncbi:MAG: amino acid adenylation domain-containing protein [Acidimicrobiales bacterium]
METDGATVADLLDAAAARAPGAVAAVADGQSLTYGELDARANRLAHRLQSCGVGPDAAVGVCLTRSLDLAVAVWAVQKAGGACVPLDPAYPDERLASMADDAGLVAVLTRADLAGRLLQGRATVVRLDTDAADWAAQPSTAAPRATGPEHLGYVIYTSGSTGRPKGVLLTHRGLVNHHRAVVELYGLGPEDRVLQFCSVGFDASIEEMFPTWAAGATVVFRPEDVPLLGRGWLDWLGDQGVTVVNLPTAYWHAWARELDGAGWAVPEQVRLVVVGGEKAFGPAFRAWQRVAGGRSRWVNAYGPTETTCMSTSYEPPLAVDADDGDPPIGRPLPHTTVAVVDDSLRPVPAGVTGELLIGGAGLARGYHNAPELTAERFVAWPEGDGGAARMYRTGDLVRQLPGGDLEYVGRIDGQVKIRGFRVEVGEVEAALARHPSVAEVAVFARDDPPGDKQLVAYVAGVDVDADRLRRFLTDRLPDHLVPAAFVLLDGLPFTPHGKVDRDALPAPTRPPCRAAPRSAAEERMAAIWARVLGLDVAGVGPDDDFFQLGGHSLLATQVIAQVREEFGTETPLRAIFQAPALGPLTAVVEAEAAGPAAGPPLAGRPHQHGEHFPLSLAQEQMWGLEAAAVPQGLYNVTALHRFDAPVDTGGLRRALAYVVDRHEILRCGFVVDDGRPRQFLAGAADVELLVTELGQDELDRAIGEQDGRPFDLARPPLVRAGLYIVDDGSARFAVTLDHLVCDGTGAAIFMSELQAAYDADRTGGAPSLPPLIVQFPDFARWQRAHVTDDILRRQLGWWGEILDGMPLGPVVAFDHVPDAPTRRIASRAVAVGPETRARLEEVARATGSTLFTVGVAAAAALFGRHGGSTDVVMSTTLSGRTRAELEDLVGMFSGIGRLRTDLSGDPTFTEIVSRTRERVLGMFDNQDIPFMQVRRALLPDFPTGGPEVAAALPVEFQYFHVSQDQELFFRGQLHPLSLTLLDDGTRISGGWSYKLDYYEPSTVDRLAVDLERLLEAVGADPSLRFSELPVTPPPPGPARLG